jgi:metal-dependent hydrolase (beta-lactamase superfamily II)
LDDDQDEGITQTIAALVRHKVRTLRPGHCTGKPATRVLDKIYGESCQPLRVGADIRF